MKKMNKKGFTLIELLAVIVILGILMLIAIPSVTKYIASSRQKTFKNTASLLVDAVRNDVVSNDTGTCYVDVQNIELEKGNKANLEGYIVATKGDDGTYTYTVNLFDSANKLALNGVAENGINDAEIGTSKTFEPATETACSFK